MKSRRDYIFNILSVKRRSANYISAYPPSRMYALEEVFRIRSNLHPELLRYIPIGLIACLEGVCRAGIRELIDFGSPYFDNVASFKDITFDFKVIHALQQKTITVGDFVAHLLPISSFEQINNHMTHLLGEDFLSKLKTVQEKWNIDPECESNQLIIQEPNKVFEGVKKTFELRHIYAHELATDNEPEPDLIADCFTTTKTFIDALTALIADLIYPYASLSNYEMKLKASEELEAASNEMKEIYEQIVSKLKSVFDTDPAYLEFFELAQTAWEDFADKQTWFLADLRGKGGTGQPLFGMQAALDLTCSRTKELLSFLAEIERYYAEEESS